jgi:protein SCO1/2
MLRTVLLCAALLWAAYAGAARLTHGFQAWTAEGARRLEVALAPVATPPVRIEGPGVADADLRTLLANGRDVTVVEFIYTRCETVCLAAGGVFQQIQEALQSGGAAPGVRLLSISFDPARDRVTELAAYAQRLHADPRRWRFVRVPAAADLQRLLQAFQVIVVPTGRADFEHNAALLVVDRDGRLVRIFDLAEQQLALDYAQHLAHGGEL